MNQLVLSGVIAEKKSLRYTPAGVPVSEAVLAHRSEEMEAGQMRQVSLELLLLALGPSAQWLQGAAVGGAVQVTGFLAAKSQNSKTPVLHVTAIEFLEGN